MLSSWMKSSGLFWKATQGTRAVLFDVKAPVRRTVGYQKLFFLITQLTVSQCPIGPHHILCLLQAHIPPLWENRVIVVIEEQLDRVVFFLTVIIWIFIVGWFFTLVQEEKWEK